MNLRLKLAPERRQIMTFALHQALRILQMPQLELAEWIHSEIERNPLLEERDVPKNKLTPLELPVISAQTTLRDHLRSQARESLSDSNDLQLANDLIDQLDDRGWLTTPIEEIDYKTERILFVLQTFDPPGIGARNLRESLLLQLRRQPYSLAEILIRDHFQDLLQRRFTTVKKRLRISSADLQEALHTLSRLSMRPASLFEHSIEPSMIPDLTLKEIDQGWLLEVGEEELPNFSIRTDYIDLIPTLRKSEEKDTMRGWVTSAKWLKRCLKRRRDILRTIGRLLIKRESSYFGQSGEIVPISIHELAEILGVHETTAWRAVRDKTLACPRGLIGLQQFFSESRCADATKEFIYRQIAKEDKSQPLTDEEISKKLQQKGINCARRTVAKYRRLMKIGHAAQRKALG